jgi:hypothetical protein
MSDPDGRASHGMNDEAAPGADPYTAYDEFSELGAFALSWTALARYVYVGAWLAFAGVCLAHLRTLGRAHLPLKAAAILGICALGITVQGLKVSDWRATSGQASTLQRLEPPSIRIAGTQASTDFFASSVDLKAGLDKERSKEPEGGADASDD